MDHASNTIDRHTPEIPPSVWQGLSPEQERTYTLLKNKIILPNCGIPTIARSASPAPRATTQRTITDEQLREAGAALSDKPLSADSLTWLHARGITDPEITRFRLQETAALVSQIAPETAAAMSLRLPPHLPGPHTIEGVSIPVLSRGTFLGFATRIRNNQRIKYAFSIPHRLCFGDDPQQPEVYVVEGVFDAIALRRLGINAMALGDSQPNYFKMSLVARYPKVVLLFDDDLPGTIGCLKAHLILTKMLAKPESEINIKVVTGGVDPEQAVVSGATSFCSLSYRETLGRLAQWEKHHEQVRAAAQRGAGAVDRNQPG